MKYINTIILATILAVVSIGSGTSQVQRTYDQFVPAGAVMAFATQACPAGWLEADGEPLSRSAQPRLFSAIGTSHGFDNATTFRKPDYRGLFLRMIDRTKGNDLDKASRTAMATGGATQNNVGSVQSSAAPNITALFSSAPDVSLMRASDVASGAFSISGSARTFGRGYQGTPQGGGDLNFNASLSSSVYKTTNEVRPVNAYVLYCIKS